MTRLYSPKYEGQQKQVGGAVYTGQINKSTGLLDWVKEGRSVTDTESPEKQKWLGKQEEYRAKGMGLDLGQRYVSTAKIVGSILIPAFLVLGGIAAFAVLWEWFTTGYNWAWGVGAIFVLILIIRRMR